MKKSLLVVSALLVTAFIFSGCSKTADKKAKAVVPAINDGFVLVEGGSYKMGSDFKVKSGFYSHKVHQATVSNFYASKYAVTQQEFVDVMGYNPSWYDNSESAKKAAGEEDGTKRACDHMTWYEAVVYCNKLSMKNGLEPCYYMNLETDSVNEKRSGKGLSKLAVDGKNKTTDSTYRVDGFKFTSESGKMPEKVQVYDTEYWGKIPTDWSPKWAAIKWDREANGYRLFTEAEWEYAARGGKLSKGYTSAGFNFGDDNAGDYAWYSKNSKEKVHQVGLKLPNELGLYDMVGNVYVWCWDWFDENYYTKESASYADTEGPSGGDFKVVRGDSWDSSNSELGVEIRGSSSPYLPSRRVGMRLVRSQVASSGAANVTQEDMNTIESLKAAKQGLRKDF